MNADLFLELVSILSLIVLLVKGAWKTRSGRWAISGFIAGTLVFYPIYLVPTSFLPNWLRMARAASVVAEKNTAFTWQERLPGFATGTLDVSSGGKIVDRLILLRVDPRYFTFEVHHQPNEPLRINEWREKLGAVAVVNGSYYENNLMPTTPIWQDGIRKGPTEYQSQHGAFIVRDFPEIVDLKGSDINALDGTVRSGMVSYPLLIDGQGKNRAGGRHDWVANRSFVGIDNEQQVVIGTTIGAYFSLKAFGDFLLASDLKLVYALNLDGGPVACLSAEVPGFGVNALGKWELQDHHTIGRLWYQSLTHRLGYTPLRPTWSLPIVMAVRHKDALKP
jgi:hypothetical protein